MNEVVQEVERKELFSRVLQVFFPELSKNQLKILAFMMQHPEKSGLYRGNSSKAGLHRASLSVGKVALIKKGFLIQDLGEKKVYLRKELQQLAKCLVQDEETEIVLKFKLKK
jgi:hypothetical protein